jgi:hypothetical protein
MTASDKKKTAILIVLIIVAVGAWVRMARTDSTPSTGGSAATPGGKSKALSATGDAQIRYDILETGSSAEVGRRNLFAYRTKPAPPKPIETVRPVIPPPVVADTPRPVQPIVPPPPPFRSFRYEGFSVNRGTGKILGSLTESGNTYEVEEGECLMGQYCITRLTETLIEIEDLQLKRKQTFTRAQ